MFCWNINRVVVIVVFEIWDFLDSFVEGQVIFPCLANSFWTHKKSVYLCISRVLTAHNCTTNHLMVGGKPPGRIPLYAGMGSVFLLNSIIRRQGFSFPSPIGRDSCLDV